MSVPTDITTTLASAARIDWTPYVMGYVMGAPASAS